MGVQYHTQAITYSYSNMILISMHTDILLNDVTLSRDGKIAVASSLTVFLVASTLFFIFGFLCGHSVGKKRETMVETSVAEIQTYLQDDIVHTNSESPQQNFELELTANVAYSSVHL